MAEEGAARAAGPERPLAEDYIAQRVKLEREVRGWSTVTLAERMTAAGHPINQSAIWRIESGKPRRRVNLDEALGFCKVFDITLDDLTAAPGHIANPKVRRLVGEYVEQWKQWRALGKAMDAIQAELREYTEAHPDQDDLVKALLTHELAVASNGEFRHHLGARPKMQSWLRTPDQGTAS
ncbi:helix-turn-helix domain-containing protein [Streptomyces sp. NBC_01476]|uniref:helix-turn-helix domain-containing protein n=1 Tax=Streptomyces sp. NBC_01476 TaxID=2903881 RepID=UPI002E37CECE|nr:helix-turn-helix transcriptional regulator [Streptomyces sp. NBC_01476]